MEIRAHREEMAIMWLHLDGEAITEARHCVICQPHGHVIDAACADCGDGPLITGQPPDLGGHPAGPEPTRGYSLPTADDAQATINSLRRARIRPGAPRCRGDSRILPLQIG